MHDQTQGDKTMCATCQDWEAELQSQADLKPRDVESVRVHPDTQLRHVSM